ncbi:MAG: hypothetical protein D8H92_06505, partial [Campylobacter sp.]
FSAVEFCLNNAEFNPPNKTNRRICLAKPYRISQLFRAIKSTNEKVKFYAWNSSKFSRYHSR